MFWVNFVRSARIGSCHDMISPSTTGGSTTRGTEQGRKLPACLSMTTMHVLNVAKWDGSWLLFGGTPVSCVIAI